MIPVSVLLALQGASAAILTVPSPTYPTLEAAVAGAASGDEIRLRVGQTVSGQLDIGNRNLTIVGERQVSVPNADTSVGISSGLGTSMFRVGASGTLTMRNVDLSFQRDLLLDGGLPEVSAAQLYLSNYGQRCGSFMLEDEVVPRPSTVGGVDVRGGTVLLEGVRSNCLTYVVSGHGNVQARTYQVSQTRERNSQFIGAQVAHFFMTSGSLAIEDAVLEQAFGFGAVSAGRPIILNELDPLPQRMSSVSIRRSFVNRNSTRFDDFFGGGGVYAYADTVELVDNIFQDNVSNVFQLSGSGGATSVEGGTALIQRNRFCNNISYSGGAVYFEGDQLNFLNNEVVANNGLYFGGGLHVQGVPQDDINVVNNTFLGNTGGRTPEWVQPTITFVVGGGGHAMFDGTVPTFRNNIVAFSPFGGGVAGVDARFGGDYIVGDPIDVEYNIFFSNTDGQGGDVNFTGDFASLAVPQSNIFADPMVTYWGTDDFNCYVDRFYTDWTAPGTDNGDPLILDRIQRPGGLVNRSDIGAYGGPGADVVDRDGDGYENIYDCNDVTSEGGATVNPGALEICDGLDNNCNGLVDEGFDNRWYRDADGDGYGDINDVVGTFSCTQPPGMVASSDDCDDSDDAINPAAVEVCDGVDNNCSGTADDNLQIYFYYLDTDGDGFGNPAVLRQTCETEPLANESLITGDCDDNRPEINPNAAEVCDGRDTNCDGLVDNVVPLPVWYLDADGDGLGATGSAIEQCFAPSDAYVLVGGDCDDNDASVLGPVILYPDFDGDGLGDGTLPQSFCPNEIPPGDTYVTNAADCDDSDPFILECDAGCGCASAPSGRGAGLLALLIGVLAVRRRRLTTAC